jgi:TetR/AcrR family transcriptional repressor of nem operon
MLLKERIVKEALVLFATKGYMNTSIAEIIERAQASKGGLYNHFKSKEELFMEALSTARKNWRERNLKGVAPNDRPLRQIKTILENYRDHYLPEDERLPGGCIFVGLVVELSDQEPRLAAEVNEGFVRFKGMLTRLLEKERLAGGLQSGVEVAQVVNMVFSGLLGACVVYTSDKSRRNLDMSIGALIDHLSRIAVSPL